MKMTALPRAQAGGKMLVAQPEHLAVARVIFAPVEPNTVEKVRPNYRVESRFSPSAAPGVPSTGRLLPQLTLRALLTF
jgi:hypothetical protein